MGKQKIKLIGAACCLVVFSSGCMLFGWGENDLGQIGDGTSSPRSAPTRVGPAGDWRAVSAAARHTCAVAVDNALWCWGDNAAGQLGAGTREGRSAPTRVGNERDWRSVGAGDQHTCGRRGAGTLWCWGGNDEGQLGDGSTDEHLAPTLIGSADDWKAVSAGSEHTCGVRGRGTLWCWGENSSGQLGLDDSESPSVPTQVGSASDWRAVSAGSEHTCGVRGGGTLWCWGENDAGQLGDDSTRDRSEPTQVGSRTDWLAVAAAVAHTCGLRGQGTLWCWGENDAGQLGDDSTRDRSEPTQVESQTDWVAVAGAATHTCGVRSGGTMWCWGDNNGGKLGDGTTTDRRTPTRIGIDTDWVDVDAGGNHTMGLRRGSEQPNVVFVMADDMRPDEMTRVADLKPGGGFDWMRDHGTQFERLWSTDNLCCPGRVTALTGQTPYNHGAFGIGFVDLRNSLPLWLQRAGYCTGFTGKIMNGYVEDNPRPAGWTHWEPLTDENWTSEDAYVIERRDGSVWQPGTFVTDHLAAVSKGQLDDCLDGGDPAFVALWPRAPHIYSEPEADYAEVEVPWANSDPSFNELDISDKPSWFQSLHANRNPNLANMAQAWTNIRVRTLLSVDDAVRSLLDDLEARGELENTLVVLTSDNGYLMGEHRVFQRKEYAFEAAQPTAWIAGPGFRSGATSDAFVTNLDLAPTIVETTGATSGLTMDGRSIQDVLAEPDLGRDRYLPIFIPLPPPRPRGDATRTSRYKYAAYTDGTEELYDLFVDPYEETDVSDDPSYASVKAELRALLETGKVCTGNSCRASAPAVLQWPG